MTVLLLVVIYIAFIGLGIPDSLIGSAWPAVYKEFQIPVSYVSCVTLLVSGCTVLSSIFSDRIINRMGTGRVTAVSTIMTAAAMLGFSVSGNINFMCLLAIPLGMGAGAIDSGLNNYIALHYNASHMNYLHCFYGIGVACSPYLMSVALAKNSWRSGYRYAFGVQSAIAVILLISLPIWNTVSKRADKNRQNGEEIETKNGSETKILSFAEMIKMPQVRWIWIIMLATNAIEYACGTWGSTYLVEAGRFQPENAAKILTLYYVGMALGRFLSGVFAARITTWKRIWAGTAVVLAALLVLTIVPAAGFFLVGLGNGSIYPNLIYLTPYHFGQDVSQSVMGSQIAAAYLGVMLTPPLFGILAEWWGIQMFPVFLAALFGIMTLALVEFVKKMKTQGQYREV